MFELGPNAWAYAVIGVMLIVASITDIRTGKIYNWITYPAILAGLIGHFVLGGLAGKTDASGAEIMGLAQAVIGLLVGFVPMYIARMAGGIGGGDAKAMAAVGALCGWQFALSAMFYGLGVALIMSLIVLMVNRMTVSTLKRIGNFLLLTFVKAKPADPSTPESPKIPIGVAFCIGSGIVLLLTCLFGPNPDWFLMGL